jgi:hypothetical protein
MTTTDKTTTSTKKKRLLPKPGKKRETLEQSLKAIKEQYGEALARLAK